MFWYNFGEGNGTPLQYSCLENPMDGEAWWAAVHGVAKSRTRLSNFPFTFHFHALEKEMATHSSVLAWRIPGMGEPGGLPSMGSHRVGHDCRTATSGNSFALRPSWNRTRFSTVCAMNVDLDRIVGSASGPWHVRCFLGDAGSHYLPTVKQIDMDTIAPELSQWLRGIADEHTGDAGAKRRGEDLAELAQEA